MIHFRLGGLMKLYELTEAYAEVLELDLEEQDLSTVLDSLQGTVAEKAEGILMVMKTLEAEQDAYSKEQARLNELKSKAKKKADAMKDYLAYNLQQMDIKKLDTTLFKLSFRKSESVVVDDQTQLPEEYIKVKTTESPDKTALKKALKNGEVKGCHIETKQNLQIK